MNASFLSIHRFSFAILALPYFSLRVYIDYKDLTHVHNESLETLVVHQPWFRVFKHLTFTLRISTSLVNPLLYGCSTRDIKTNIKYYARRGFSMMRRHGVSLSVSTKSSLNISMANEVSYNFSSMGEEVEGIVESVELKAVQWGCGNKNKMMPQGNICNKNK